MDKDKPIDKIIDEALNSLDNVKRASPMPFLLTRINARLDKTSESAWEMAVRFIGRPVFAVPALATLILINAVVIVLNKTDSFSTVSESVQVPADDFSYSVATMYDFENTEP